MHSKLKVVNVEAAIYKEGKWLFVKRSKRESHQGGSLSFVGGKVEEDGNLAIVLEKTLMREIKEEVNIEVVDNLLYLTSSHFITNDGDSVVDIVFLCEYKSGEPNVTNIDEVSEIHWLTYDEALNNKLVMSWTKNYLELAHKTLNASS